MIDSSEWKPSAVGPAIVWLNLENCEERSFCWHAFTLFSHDHMPIAVEPFLSALDFETSENRQITATFLNPLAHRISNSHNVTHSNGLHPT